ncbi:NAD(P)/FAD-dependent oxidoreductase [Candidatus Margulisiibacteriota bacterium]
MKAEIEYLEKTLLDDNNVEYAADLIIVGGGPAAIVASQYALRGDMKVIIFEPRELARKVSHHKVWYLPGLEGPIGGSECARILGAQVRCQIIQEEVSRVISRDPKRQVVYTDEKQYYARAVLIATGLRRRNLGVPGEEDFRSRGVFIALDAIPNVECVKSLVDLDQYGFIKTSEDMMTKTPGIFAAGDVRTKYLRQVVTAAADGATAALAIENYLRE